jgi:hypothetical protein
VQIDFLFCCVCVRKSVFVFCMRAAALRLEKRGLQKECAKNRVCQCQAAESKLHSHALFCHLALGALERERGYATRGALARSLIPWLHPSCILLGKYNALIMCTYPRGRHEMYLKHTRKSIREIFFLHFLLSAHLTRGKVREPRSTRALTHQEEGLAALSAKQKREHK